MDVSTLKVPRDSPTAILFLGWLSMTRATASQSSVSETALFIGTIEVEFLSTDIYILMHVWQTPVRGGWTVRLRVHALSVCLDKRIDESVNKTKA